MATHAPARRSLLVLIVGAVVGALALLLLGPKPPTLGAPTGDAALAAQAAAAIGEPVGYDRVSVVRIEGDTVTWAGFGDVTPDSRFELGSITKTFDGLLLADAVARGEVRLDDRLDAHLPELAGTPAGSATLEELASHRSGLDTIARWDWPDVAVSEFSGKVLREYSATSPDALVTATRGLSLGNRGTFSYSNLGASLLGLALMRAAAAPDWATYVQQRLWQPLGMTATQVADPGRPAPDLVPLRLANGQVAEPWTSTAYAPAGVGITTTASDLTRYARAVLEGRAPGLDALTPRWPAAIPPLGKQRVGLAWLSLDADGQPWSWHNGGTTGARTTLVIDRDQQRAVLLLGNTGQDLTGAGFTLLGAQDTGPRITRSMSNLPAAALGVLTALLLAVAAARATSRAKVVSRALGTLGSLVLWWLAAPWDALPAWVLGATAGLAAASAVVAGRRWSGLPTWPQRRRPLAVAGLVVGALWCVGIIALAVAVAARG